MRIIIVSHHTCGRVLKICRALKKVGYELHLVANRIPADRNIFDSLSYYHNAKDLETTLNLFSDKDVYHVHNEPSWMATVIRTKYPKARIILDMHDSNYWRVEGMEWYEEDVAMQSADALVITSESMKNSLFKYGKPTIVIPSAILKEDFRYGSWHYWGGLVSQGGHSLPNEENPLESWRDYTALYTLLKGRKQVFAYSPMFRKGSELDKHYISLGAKLGTYTHQALLDEMGKHDWSLVGNLKKDRIWDLALPNKFYDSMAAGIPVVNFGCKEVTKLVDEYKVGINVDTVDELIERWGERMNRRYDVHRHRMEFTIERHIPKLEKLYGEI